MSENKNEVTWIESQKEIIEQKEEIKAIFDMNIKSVDDLVNILSKEDFDFLVIEPWEIEVKISFKKNSLTKSEKIIKYPTYSSILIWVKKLCSLDIEKNDIEQKWNWNFEFNKESLEIIAKTVPSNFWENIFFKINKVDAEKKEAPKKKNIDLKVAFSFLLAVLIVSLVVWWGFLSFIVFNANTVQDVSFFYNLWINLNQINSFLLIATTIVFSILIFIETVFLIVFLFKALLTKKEFKRKKTLWTLVSIVVFMVTFWTWSAWMSVDQAIRQLPNWQEMSYGNIQLYDNDLLTNKNYDKETALIRDYTNIIWPITIKFDLSYYWREESRKWFQIKKYIWDFWWDDIVETLSPELIKEFQSKWNYNLKIKVEWEDRTWKLLEKEVWDSPKLNIWYMVWVKENTLNNWWKTIELDASELKVLWDIEWYLESDLEKPAYVWEVFRPSKVYFEKEIIWMQIKSKYQNWNSISKIFMISWNESTLDWDIEAKSSIDNDLEYTFSAKDIENTFWNWFIKSFKWSIEWETFDQEADVTDLIWSSKITHVFDNYWEQTIKLLLTNTSWNSKEITKKINIPKNINLNEQIEIKNDWINVDNVKFDKTTNEYFIYEIGIPTKLSFDAAMVRWDSPLYSVENIEWNLEQNWKSQKFEWKTMDYNIEVEWSIKIEVKFTLKHRRNAEDTLEKIQKIYIEPSKKEVMIDLQVKSSSDYAPAIVSFDASLSQVKWENINKFIYDYWDGSEPEERDAKNYWRRYLKEWTYDIKLTIVTDKWNEYSATKKLVLKPKPQTVSISSSLKEAPVWQNISFFSNTSSSDISWYDWNFGDWGSSQEANPSHSYSSTWKYNVKLTIYFTNNNVLTAETEVVITD